MNDNSQSETNEPEPSGEKDPKKRALMRSRRGRTGETFWYTIAGYLLLVGFSIGYFVSGTIIGSVPLDGGLLLLGLILFSVLPYPAFVLDTGYLRSTESTWIPQWKSYFGIGVLSPVLMSGISNSYLTSVEALGIGLVTFLLITVGICTFHLVQRYRYVGLI